MSWLLNILVCTMLVMSVPLLRAGDPAEKRPGRAESERKNEEWKNLSPEDRESRLKERKTNGAPSREEWTRRREAFQKMTPQEREVKRKEIKARLEKRIA